MRRVYLDHAATSPTRPAVVSAMADWLQRCSRGELGDPSRSHTEALTARAEIERAREAVADLLGARPREVVFCSGATEAIAAAASGTVGRGAHTVLSAVEHRAVREWAERGHHTIVGVDRSGRIDLDHLQAAITADTAVVHLQWGNHELGTVQPVVEAAAICRDARVLLHVDAAQTAGHVPIDFAASGIDLLSVSAHKLGGPTGVGALLVRRGLRIDPLLVGGDQERARRAGMEHGTGIIGFGASSAELSVTLAEEADRCRALSDELLDWADGDGHVHGVGVLGSRDHRLPHIVCLQIAGVEPQAVLAGLDRAGIAVHSGNSCSSESMEPSPVLTAIGVGSNDSLRVSFGWSSTRADLDRLLDVLPDVLRALRSLQNPTH